MDSTFLEMMEFEIVPTGVAYDRRGIYLNETAIKELELNPLPTSFKRYSEDIPVLGVVRDFHFRNLYEPIGPAIIGQLRPDWWAWSIFIKTDGRNTLHTIKMIEEAYREFTGGIPMQFEFVDNTIKQWYKKEESTTKIVGYFAILTIVIAIMGIFAMSSYFIRQRMKDIGIRKVYGAQSLQVLFHGLLSTNGCKDLHIRLILP